jgi:hypothetical protein
VPKQNLRITLTAEAKLIELAQRVCEYFGEDTIHECLDADIEVRALARTALELAGIKRRSLKK